MAKPDGSSDAKAGDLVVTGGGIFEKLADGSSRFVESLDNYIGKSKSGSYSDVAKAYQKYTKGSDKAASKLVDDAVSAVTGDTVTGDPETFEDYYSIGSSGSLSSSGTISGSTIVGYIIVALVGVVVLDRLIGGDQ